MIESYRSAPGASMANGSAWGAFNAVTHYATHVKGTRDTSGAGDAVARLKSNLFGDAGALKQRAMMLLDQRYAVLAA